MNMKINFLLDTQSLMDFNYSMGTIEALSIQLTKSHTIVKILD
jgi:hypothetical protein